MAHDSLCPNLVSFDLGTYYRGIRDIPPATSVRHVRAAPVSARVVALTNKALTDDRTAANQIASPQAKPDDTYAVRLTASAQGKTVATTIMRINREGWLNIPGARLWSPADPFLYDLQAELIRVKNPWPKEPDDRNRRTPRFGAKETA